MSINERWEKDKQCNTKNRFACAFTRGCSWDHSFSMCRIHEGQRGGYEKDTMSKSKVKYNNKTRKVNVDNQGRYIHMDGEIVYLKTIRGQYRYV